MTKGFTEEEKEQANRLIRVLFICRNRNPLIRVTLEKNIEVLNNDKAYKTYISGVNYRTILYLLEKKQIKPQKRRGYPQTSKYFVLNLSPSEKEDIERISKMIEKLRSSLKFSNIEIDTYQNAFLEIQTPHYIILLEWNRMSIYSFIDGATIVIWERYRTKDKIGTMVRPLRKEIDEYLSMSKENNNQTKLSKHLKKEVTSPEYKQIALILEEIRKNI